jgi:hypothetical protein
MSTSTTIIISIATTTSTATLAARGKVIGSTTHNTEEMRLMGTDKPRINSVVRALEIAPAAEREIDPVVGRELAIVPVAAELVLQVAELVIDLVAEQELAIVLVAEQELATVPVAVELEHDQEVVELEHDQEAVVRELDHPRARPAVALKTKSVTAAHRRGLLLLTAEDLAAAAAETTRGRAAAEVVIAWEVAE